MQVGHILGENGVRRDFDIKNCKLLKTMFPRRLTVFCEFVIVSFVMELNKNFKVRGPKCGFDKKRAKKDYYEASDNLLQTGHLLGSNRVQGEFHRKSSKG